MLLKTSVGQNISSQYIYSFGFFIFSPNKNSSDLIGLLCQSHYTALAAADAIFLPWSELIVPS